ncbi:MAG TPA: peptidase C11 [Clostridiales bacterium]|nr:peptidase C11 [Clostridiales bacterium]
MFFIDRPSGGNSRKKRVSGPASGGGVFRRGSGLGSGGRPVGQSGGYQDRRAGGGGPIGGGTGDGGSRGPGLSGGRAPRGCSLLSGKTLLVLIGAVVLFFIIRTCTGQTGEPTGTTRWTSAPGSSTTLASQTGAAVSPAPGIMAPRTARTKILGGGRDVFTIMVYMCGSDLETDAGMATADINEMLYADIGDNLNIIIETGGAKKWKNSVISNTTNQRYQVTADGLAALDKNVGKKPMTDPQTLTDFISYCADEFPANRYGLILWDHGSGSLGGFGYDQLFPAWGSMPVSQIYAALENAGVDFDFVGFDACLMATLETAYMLNYRADYMIASEETEPGIGWYYTNWISKLSANPSMATEALGKLIVDDYIAKCRADVPSQTATLSVVDLVALNNSVDNDFRAFAKSADAQLDADYRLIANARGDAREFGRSGFDQVDLIDLAENIDSVSARQLVGTLQDCICYNRTSANISQANGLSIYFPYDELKNLSSMLKIYDQIGMSDEYNSLIRKFANLAVGGQITTSGSSSPFSSLTGGGTADSLWSTAWNLFFANADFSQYTGGAGDWIDSGLIQDNAGYYERNYLNAGDLELTDKNGTVVLQLSDEQWDLIQSVELNVFFDDGEGYIDLGLDNIYEFDSDGDLLIDFDGTWLALDDHVAAFYVDSYEDDGSGWSMSGRVPALLNDRRVDIIIKFDSEFPYGVVCGARAIYADAAGVVPKGLTPIAEGDQIDFLCDFYSYDEVFLDSYYLGEPMIADGALTVSNVLIGDDRCLVTYRLTDIYNNIYWTPALEWDGR